MFTLRCTQRLLTRLKGSRTVLAASQPTTRLGDWYANLLHVGRLQLVLAISERTFLPIVLPAAPANTIPMRLRNDVAHVLRALSVDSATIDAEVGEMGAIVLGRTANRQVTGVLVDFAKGIDLLVERESSFLACSVKLAKTPCGPLYKTEVFPDRATTTLFQQARETSMPTKH